MADCQTRNSKSITCTSTVKPHHSERTEEKTALTALGKVAETNRKASTLSKFMKPDHKRMSRVMGYALTIGDADAWSGFATVAMAKATVAERAGLAWAALRALDTPEQVEQVVEAVLSHAGYPLPALLSPMSDARWWASIANRSERKAYALAAYDAMSLEDQMAFRKYISEVEIAA